MTRYICLLHFRALCLPTNQPKLDNLDLRIPSFYSPTPVELYSQPCAVLTTQFHHHRWYRRHSYRNSTWNSTFPNSKWTYSKFNPWFYHLNTIMIISTSGPHCSPPVIFVGKSTWILGKCFII